MPPSKLDIDLIVSEAISLMEEQGLEAISLRKIASRLNVRAPSLYRHFEDKSDLYALMAAKIFRNCIRRIPACTDWQAWLTEFGVALWEEQRRAAGALQLIGAVNASNAAPAPDMPEVIEPLTELGLPRQMADAAQRSVQALVTGWTTISPSSDEADFSKFYSALNVLIAGWVSTVASAR